jgi:phospholipid transport system substrate-binding protein
MNKYLKSCCVLIALSSGVALVPCAAAAQETSVRADQVQQTPAGKFIQDLGSQAMGVITNKALSEAQRTVQYHEILRKAFDLRTIGRFVLGRAWNSTSQGQQQEFMELFEKLVVEIYGDRMKFYNGESFRVRGTRQESERDTIVLSEIEHPGGQKPTTVDWRVRKQGDNLAVIDVVINGVSQSVTQRQEYAAIIQRDGGKLDALLAHMRERVNAGQSSGT